MSSYIRLSLALSPYPFAFVFPFALAFAFASLCLLSDSLSRPSMSSLHRLRHFFFSFLPVSALLVLIVRRSQVHAVEDQAYLVSVLAIA